MFAPMSATPIRDRVRELVRACESGQTLEALERFYAEEVVVFENYERARAGRQACIEHERAALAEQRGAPKLVARAFAADEASGVSFVEWVIRFEGEDGRPMRLEEVAVQRWANGQIVEERFYYEGAIDEGD